MAALGRRPYLFITERVGEFLVALLKICEMGRKKYYCDFCDRYFNDDKNTRQKHLNSVTHLNLKKEHYNMFRDPETLLKEESVKKPCRKFHVEGYCPFGGSCTFSHYSQQDLNTIRYELLVKKERQQVKDQTIESWLLKYNQNLLDKRQKREQLLWSNQLPPELLANASLLPMSLQPYHIQDFIDADLESWG